MALAILLASSASSQGFEGTIPLPDSLGPLTGISHVALDERPGHPRMFIGGEDGNVLVMNTLTGERLARIQSGQVKSICFSPAQNNLYISLVNEHAIVVFDCGSYQMITKLQPGSLVTGFLYNPLVDRV
jgi:DNA-binding beta-propeller fold protein YncE